MVICASPKYKIYRYEYKETHWRQLDDRAGEGRTPHHTHFPLRIPWSLSPSVALGSLFQIMTGTSTLVTE